MRTSRRLVDGEGADEAADGEDRLVGVVADDEGERRSGDLVLQCRSVIAAGAQVLGELDGDVAEGVAPLGGVLGLDADAPVDVRSGASRTQRFTVAATAACERARSRSATTLSASAGPPSGAVFGVVGSTLPIGSMRCDPFGRGVAVGPVSAASSDGVTSNSTSRPLRLRHSRTHNARSNASRPAARSIQCAAAPTGRWRVEVDDDAAVVVEDQRQVVGVRRPVVDGRVALVDGELDGERPRRPLDGGARLEVGDVPRRRSAGACRTCPLRPRSRSPRTARRGHGRPWRRCRRAVWCTPRRAQRTSPGHPAHGLPLRSQRGPRYPCWPRRPTLRRLAAGRTACSAPTCRRGRWWRRGRAGRVVRSTLEHLSLHPQL